MQYQDDEHGHDAHDPDGRALAQAGLAAALDRGGEPQASLIGSTRSVFRGAVDAVASRRLGLEAQGVDRLSAVLADAVGAVGQLGQGPFDVLEGLPQRCPQGLGLTTLSGHLAGVGEVGVVGQARAPQAELIELGQQVGALLLQQGAVIDGRGVVGDTAMRLLPPTPVGARMCLLVGLSEVLRTTPSCRAGWWRSRTWPRSSWTTRMSAPWASMWVAQEWRSTWGWTRSSMPAARALLLEHAPDALAGEPPAPGVEEHRLGVAAPGPAPGLELGPAPGTEPVVEGPPRRSGPGERDAPCPPCRAPARAPVSDPRSDRLSPASSDTRMPVP